MTIPQAVLLGLVQGLTEFLPVSSSGHLVIFQVLMGFDKPPILFDVLVHLATLVAVGVYFRKRFMNIDKTQIKLLVVGSIPAGIAGLLIERKLEILFSSLWIVALGLLVTSILLYLSSKAEKLTVKLTQTTTKQAFIVGLFQAIAIVPGISRSGATVSGGLLNHLTKDDAFYFSFLLAVPAILGAAFLQTKELTSIDQILSVANVLGFITAAISGLGALRMLNLVIHKAKFHYFAVYCLTLSLLICFYQLWIT